MSRRILGTALLAAGLLGVVAAPFTGAAHAVDCPTWTDGPGDASIQQLGLPGTTNSNLDIVATTISTVGTNIVFAIKTTSLQDKYQDAGDRFMVQFTVATQNMKVYADRGATGAPTVTVANGDTSKPKGTGTVAYEAGAKSTVTITVPVAELDKAVGSSTKGQTTNSPTTITQGAVDGTSFTSYDVSPAPTTVTYTVGAACGSAVVPTPEVLPRTGCNTVDGGDPGEGQVVFAAQHPFGNDDDLDIRGVAINTTDTEIKAYVRIAHLDKPKNYGGHEFELDFKANGKAVELHVGQLDTVTSSGASATQSPTYAVVGGSKSTTLVPTPKFDKTNNMVVISAPLADLATALSGTFAAGTQLTDVDVKSWWIYSPRGDADKANADTDQAANQADRVYTLGVSPCFVPPPSKLVNTGKTTVQYSDAVAIGAKLTDEGGTAISGKKITFTVGGKSTSATTGSNGIATTTWNPGLPAGAYTLVASFDGDDTAAKVSLPTPFTVTIEKTKITLSVKKSGNARTVTAKLLDDDNHAVAGQAIVWYINGRKVATGKTNGSGIAVLSTAKPTQVVKAYFATVSNKYLTSSASMKV